MAETLTFAQKFSKFAKRNVVVLVMVPAIVVLHLGWSQLQNIEQFVPKHERKEDIPIVAVTNSTNQI